MYIQRTKFTYCERLKSFYVPIKKKEIRINIFEIIVHWNIVKVINMSIPRIHKI